jgi:hypothetical protein
MLLRQIRQLWKEQTTLEDGTTEHEALTEKIRALSFEYRTLVAMITKNRPDK